MFVYLQGYPDWKKNNYPVESLSDVVMNVEIPRLSAAELKIKLDGGEPVTVVDVRDLEDMGIGAIKGSLWIPLENLMAQFEKIPKERSVVIVCLRGKQGPLAGQYLAKQGYTKVFMLDKGIKEGWLAAGYPVEKI